MYKTLLALLLAFSSGYAHFQAIGGGGMIPCAFHIGMAGGAKAPSARDYVQDGLIAMWDGIENAGWGVHDPNATVWKDLIGDVSVPLTQYGSFGDYYLLSSSPNSNCAAKLENVIIPYSTVEVCAYKQSGASVPCVFQDGKTINAKSDDVICIGVNDGVDFWKGVYSSISSSYNVAWHGKSANNFCIAICVAENNIAYCDGEVAAVSTAGGGFSSDRGSGIAFGGVIMQSHGMAGKIYCVRLYNRVLSATEIAANYAIDKARFNLT